MPATPLSHSGVSLFWLHIIMLELCVEVLRRLRNSNLDEYISPVGRGGKCKGRVIPLPQWKQWEQGALKSARFKHK